MTDVVNEATRGIERAASSARETIGAAAEDASRSVRQAADSQRERGADAIECLANAVRAAGRELGASPTVSRYVDDAASGLARTSQALRERSAPELLRQTADLARRQPAMTFAGAVLAGIAMSRFIRSSATRAGGGGGGERDWTDRGASGSGAASRGASGASSAEARPDRPREGDRATGGGASSVEAGMPGGSGSGAAGGQSGWSPTGAS